MPRERTHRTKAPRRARSAAVMDADFRRAIDEIQETIATFPEESRQTVATLLVTHLIEETASLRGGAFPGMVAK